MQKAGSRGRCASDFAKELVFMALIVDKIVDG